MLDGWFDLNSKLGNYIFDPSERLINPESIGHSDER